MIYAFADFTLDTRRCELRRAGEPQHLEPEVYAVLCHLVEKRDRVVTKHELLDHVWGHRFITPATLNSRIKALRQALRDDGTAQRIIRTVRGRGFRFVAAVTGSPTESVPDGGREAEGTVIKRLMPLGWAGDNPAFRQFFATLFLPEGTPEQTRWFSDLQRVSTSPENAVRLRTASAEIDIRELARRVQTPTLVLHATGDDAVPFEQGRLLAALIPGARFVPLEGKNHILLESEPAWARFLEETQAFLGSGLGSVRDSPPGAVAPGLAPSRGGYDDLHLRRL
jgi:DNA-binding winged helix-turn-helix (wHTH) protein